MTRFLAVIAVAVASSALSPPSGEQGPAAELAGRIAGPPQRCVQIVSTQALRLSDNDRHVLLYGNGRTIWANPLGSNCSFRYDDVLVTEPIGSYYCRGDLVRSLDRQSHIQGPACVLGDFIPYNAH